MGKCACAIGAASRRGSWRKAEGVAQGRRALARARGTQSFASRRLWKKTGVERHGLALKEETKGAIPLARDLTSQWEARVGGFAARAAAPRITEEERRRDVTWGAGVVKLGKKEGAHPARELIGGH